MFIYVYTSLPPSLPPSSTSVSLPRKEFLVDPNHPFFVNDLSDSKTINGEEFFPHSLDPKDWRYSRAEETKHKLLTTKPYHSKRHYSTLEVLTDPKILPYHSLRRMVHDFPENAGPQFPLNKVATAMRAKNIPLPTVRTLVHERNNQLLGRFIKKSSIIGLCLSAVTALSPLPKTVALTEFVATIMVVLGGTIRSGYKYAKQEGVLQDIGEQIDLQDRMAKKLDYQTILPLQQLTTEVKNSAGKLSHLHFKI